MKWQDGNLLKENARPSYGQHYYYLGLFKCWTVAVPAPVELKIRDFHPLHFQSPIMTQNTILIYLSHQYALYTRMV